MKLLTSSPLALFAIVLSLLFPFFPFADLTPIFLDLIEAMK